MNKKYLALPIAVLSIGCITGCKTSNTITSTDTDTKTKSSEFFGDFSDSRYEQYFDVPSGLESLDTSIALYALQNARAGVANAIKGDFYSMHGFTSDSSILSDLADSEDGDIAAQIKVGLKEKEAKESIKIDSLNGGAFIDYGVDSVKPSGNTASYRYEINKSLSFFNDSILESTNEYKSTTTYNNKITYKNVDETYDMTFFAQERDEDTVGIYNKTNSSYNGVKAEYFDVNSEYDSSEVKVSDLKTKLKDYYSNFLIESVDNAISYALPSQKTTDLITRKDVRDGAEALQEAYVLNNVILSSQYYSSTKAVYDNNNIYIYQSNPSNYYVKYNSSAIDSYLKFKSICAAIEKEPRILLENPTNFLDNASNLLKVMSDVFNNGSSDVSSFLSSYAQYLFNLLNSNAKLRVLSTELVNCYKTIKDLLNYLFALTYQYNMSLMINPTNLPSTYDYVLNPYDLNSIMKKLIPVYNGSEYSCRLIKVNNEWRIDSAAVKDATYLIKNENGEILETPICYYASYKGFKLSYGETPTHDPISYDKEKQFYEPYSIGIQGFNVNEDAGKTESSKTLKSNSSNDEEDPNFIHMYSKYANNADLDYSSVNDGIYDTTIYDWVVNSKLKEDNIRVYRGYVNTEGFPIEVETEIGYKYTTYDTSFNVLGFTVKDKAEDEIIQYVGNDNIDYDYSYGLNGNVSALEIEGSKTWTKDNPRISVYPTRYYVVMFVDGATGYINEDYGIRISPANYSK